MISEFDLADPTKPKGGPEGATKQTILNYVLSFNLFNKSNLVVAM